MSGYITKYWIDHLPITHDIEEAQLQYEYLSQFVLSEPQFIFAADPAAIAS